MAQKPSSEEKAFFYLHAFKILAVGAFALIAIATVAYRFLEDWTWVDSLYFSVVAVTTVGFGDFLPTSDASKLFTVAYLIVGISLVTAWLNTRTKYRAAKRRSNS